ncbi:MAG TPA: hypothetical protein VF058_04940 [Actinomycetota bacterium]
MEALGERADQDAADPPEREVAQELVLVAVQWACGRPDRWLGTRAMLGDEIGPTGVEESDEGIGTGDLVAPLDACDVGLVGAGAAGQLGLRETGEDAVPSDGVADIHGVVAMMG